MVHYIICCVDIYSICVVCEPATLAGLMLSGWGWLTNLIVYLIEEFNVKSIDATQISNVVHGCLNMIPILGAILADSYLGSFSVVSIFSFFSLLVLKFVLYVHFCMIQELTLFQAPAQLFFFFFSLIYFCRELFFLA